MASPAQLAANRRNAQKSTGPRTNEGRKRASFNALKSGMTAKTVVLPHESVIDYDEIRIALIEDYAPATSQEMMLVDQVAVGYWRTIRARRFETAHVRQPPPHQEAHPRQRPEPQRKRRRRTAP